MSSLRMSFGEWLYRMFEAEVPPQARTLAVYAAVFDITCNDDLAKLSGMGDEAGVATRTFDKWKKFLRDDGWVIIGHKGVGRGYGIEVYPALKQTPVNFTDLLRRNPCKFYPRKDCGTPAEFTPAKTASPVIFAGDVKESFPRTPFKENTSLPRTTVQTNNLGHQQQTADDDGKIDPHRLFETLSAAANGSLYPLSVGLQVVAEPIGWIEQGADLDKDIIPVVRALSHKVKPKSIRSWAYFGPAIAEAKAARLRGLPSPLGASGYSAKEKADRTIAAIVGRRP